MRILYDFQKFSIQTHGGITRYFANLFYRLKNRPGFNTRLATLYTENAYIHNQDVLFNTLLGRKIFGGHSNRIYRWNRRYAKFILSLNQYDVFHPTYNDPYFLQGLKKPLVITVHDMIHECFPQLFSDAEKQIRHKKMMVKRADKIIAISDYTRNEILKFYPEAADKIQVVHHGYRLFAHKNSMPSSIHLPEKFLLFVGERWHYKNFNNCLQALGPVLKSNPGLQLICAGGRAFTPEETTMFKSLSIFNQCKQHTVNDAELEMLYKNARLFIFPSKQEGFGLPLLEAFANGCPVLCSDTSSLPEVAGSAAIYFNPEDVASIQTSVEYLWQNENERSRLVIAGHERLKQFSFEECAHKTAQVYLSLM